MIKAILVGVTVGVLLSILSGLLEWLWDVIGIKIPEINGAEDLRQATPIFLLVYVSILGPFLEEVLFRFIPLYPIMLYDNSYLTWSIAILASIVFGPIHGSWKHILNIGVVGIGFSWLFINFGFTSCLSAHIAHNFLCSCHILFKRNYQTSPQLS